MSRFHRCAFSLALGWVLALGGITGCGDSVLTGDSAGGIAEQCQSFCAEQLGSICTADEQGACARGCLDYLAGVRGDCAACLLAASHADCDRPSIDPTGRAYNRCEACREPVQVQ